jgi:hypothetical protein
MKEIMTAQIPCQKQKSEKILNHGAVPNSIENVPFSSPFSSPDMLASGIGDRKPEIAEERKKQNVPFSAPAVPFSAPASLQSWRFTRPSTVGHLTRPPIK